MYIVHVLYLHVWETFTLKMIYWACYVTNETWAYFDVSTHLLLYHYFLPVHVTNESFVITAEFPDSKDIFVTWNKRHTISSSCLYIVVSCAITKLPVTDSLLTLLWPYLCCWGRRQKRIKAFISSLSPLSHDPQVLLRRNALAFQRRAVVFARPRGGRSFLCPNASLRVSRRITLSWARFSVRIVQKNFGNSFRLASCGSSMWPEKLASQCQGDNGTHCCSPHIFPTLGAAGNYRGERETAHKPCLLFYSLLPAACLKPHQSCIPTKMAAWGIHVEQGYHGVMAILASVAPSHLAWNACALCVRGATQSTAEG